ncbi:hypothetical protein F7725_002712 [Dissostichus mawsoni]|uniref:Ubiquitin-like protease family profile domain-containing protein n=1 Tax=Dissostichus mawsoni TaxID=36200 RepID=A0A7J5Y429_DISMA|nr:hypothetical protein F7725_002712 [Dissostichus mawsoni]
MMTGMMTAKQGTESEDDSVDEQMYKNDDRETETDTNSESEDDADTEQVENDERKTYIGTESEEEEDNYSEVVQGEIKSEKITQTGTDSEEEDDSEIEKFVDINDDREIQTGTESEESDSDVEQVEKKTVKVKQRGMESEEDEDSEVEQGKDDEESERTIESDESTMKVKEETSRYRKIPPMPIPPLAYWLLQFLHTLGKYTTHRVNQIETDFSWALMQATLLAFNRESVDAYLARTFAIINRQKRWDEIKPTTTLHLCSAHIIKAVSNAVSRNTDDPGLREFVTFVFARIQNTVSLQSGQDIFKHLCTVLLAEHPRATTLENGDIDSESQSGWEEEEQKRAHTIVGRSPYTQCFQEAFQEAQAAIGEAEEDEDGHQPNRYHCPKILKVLLGNYMGIFPLWSGAMLGDLRRFARDKTLDPDTSEVQTRDTNCHVETWFGIVKHSILSKKKNVRPAELIRTMYSSLKGRYIEHILRHNLPENILNIPIKSTKNVTQAEETWLKRGEPIVQVKKSKFYNIPQTIPEPKKKTKTLWEQGQTELVVSVIKSQDQCVIEAYMRATLNQYDPAHRIFQIDHYTNGVILGGSREQMSRHLMRNVNLDTFDAAVSFVNVNNNHWRFLYLHVPSRSLFVMDPAAAEQDLHLSTTAVQCYNRYFRMRQNLYGKQVWGSLKWKAATIPHTVQQDTTSCGVFVMQMAKEAIQSFPAIPSFNMKNSPRDMCRLREEMAEELLSTSEKDYCSMCGLKEVPRDKDIEAVVIDWVGA